MLIFNQSALIFYDGNIQRKSQPHCLMMMQILHEPFSNNLKNLVSSISYYTVQYWDIDMFFSWADRNRKLTNISTTSNDIIWKLMKTLVPSDHYIAGVLIEIAANHLAGMFQFKLVMITWPFRANQLL